VFFAKSPRSEQPRGPLTPEEMALLSQAVAQYIRAQRARYYGPAAPLAFGSLWSRFFPLADLERLRVVQPGQERVPNPPFYTDLERLGFTGLPNFTTMGAITFDDVVVFHEPLTPQLIFHELVHVIQYRLLGVEEFARLYVRGYLHGGYDGTPLEVCAYQLDGRFIMGSVGFDVEAEVKAWIVERRF
jgi:hypothetical protein